MDATFKVNKLYHDELVNLFSTATYGNDSAIIIKPSKEYDGLKLNSQSREEYWAAILEQGGCLWVYDLYDEYTSEDDVEYYGEKGINWIETDYEVLFNKAVDTHGRVYVTFLVPTYKITMKTLLAGINANTDESWPLIQKLFIEENGDLYTAYNLMQVAVFGEIIYG